MKNRVIVWRVIKDCNMRCKFCSYSRDVERKRDNADECEILRLCNLLIQQKELTNENILVSWIGGEPFLWKNIIYYSKLLAEHGIGVSTTTNGLLVSNEMIQKKICNYFSEIVFSIDGFQECNDSVRQYENHFQIASKNIKTLNILRKSMNSNLKIKINTILMRSNIDYFEEFCEYLVSLGIDELTFNQLGGYDRPEFYSDNRLLTSQVETFIENLPKLKEKFLYKGLKIRGSDNYIERILKTTRNEKNSIVECNPAEWFWFINENGFISPCSYTSYEYKYDIKNIRDLSDIEKVESYFRNIRSTNRSKWCDDCYCTQVYDKFQ